MITFKQYVEEAGARTGSPEDIRRRCGPFLEQAGGSPLYRGHGWMLARAREVPVRKDRRPRDSTEFVHNLLDGYFQDRLGVKVRSEGLFCTGDRLNAERYGKLHYVFPVGDFRFVWGTHDGDPVRDTFAYTQELRDAMRVRYARDAEEVTAQVLDRIRWRTDDLAGAITSGAEIAVLAGSAIIVQVSRRPYLQVIGETWP